MISSHQPDPEGPSRDRREAQASRWPRRLLIGANVVVALTLVVAGSVYAYVRYRAAELKTIKLPSLTADAGTATPMNILLVGSNTRTGLDPGEAAQFGSASQVPGARSDVTMILHLDPRTGSASLLSIPRDLFVPLPAHSMAGSVGKIDAALNDGPNNLIAAITGNLGIPINHFVEINFDGFQRTIDAIGGISLNFPEPIRDSFSGLNIPTTGCRQLNGATALAVVRARHLQYYANGRWNDDPLSDLARIRRDHTFLRVFANAAKAQLTNPVRLNALVGGLVNQVTVDSGLDVSSLLALLRRWRHLNPNVVAQTTLPITVVANYHYRAGAYGDVDMPVEPLDHQVINAWSGQPDRSPARSLTSVAIVNVSGLSRPAATVRTQLGALGYAVASTGTAPSPARITETVIRYPPGSLDGALGLLHDLSGAVMLAPDPVVPAGTVTLDLGSALTVTGSAASPLTAPTVPTGPTVPAGSATPASTTLAPAPAGGLAPSSAVDQPAPYDPTAC